VIIVRLWLAATHAVVTHKRRAVAWYNCQMTSKLNVQPIMSLILPPWQYYKKIVDCEVPFMYSSVFWDTLSCNPLKAGRLFCLRASCWFFPWLILQPWRWRRHSSKTLVDLTDEQHYIPEDRTLHNHCCENLKFCFLLCSVLLSQHVYVVQYFVISALEERAASISI
jgi:hypothetical protein